MFNHKGYFFGNQKKKSFSILSRIQIRFSAKRIRNTEQNNSNNMYNRS